MGYYSEKIRKMEEINKLIAEYKADPNCFPELWIRGEDVTLTERLYFISQTCNN